MELAFATLTGGLPEYHCRTLYASTNAAGMVNVSVIGEDLSPDNPNYRAALAHPRFSRIVHVLGYKRHADPASQDLAFWRTHSDVTGIVDLIRGEIKASPEAVGYPIYLIRADKDGIQYLPPVLE